MRRIIALVVDEGGCPGCEGSLYGHEAGYYVCGNCSAVVDYEKGGWRFHGESSLRALGGFTGMMWSPKRKAA